MPSRADSPPTPAELVARAAAAGTAHAHGTFRYDGGFSLGFGWRAARPYVVTCPSGATFIAAGDAVRITDGVGLVRLTVGGSGVVRDAEQGLVAADRIIVGIGPERLLHPDVQQLATATPTTWQGRRAWLADNDRERWVLDDETSIAVRYEQRDAAGAVAGWMELVDLNLATPCDATDFAVPDAPPWVRPQDPHLESPRDPDAWLGRPFPTLGWTASGLPHFPVAGDTATGWLVQRLRLVSHAGVADLELHRRPVGISAPVPAGGHRWQAAGCDWALAVADRSEVIPTDSELATMAASVGVHTPWPAP